MVLAIRAILHDHGTCCRRIAIEVPGVFTARISVRPYRTVPGYRLSSVGLNHGIAHCGSACFLRHRVCLCKTLVLFFGRVHLTIFVRANSRVQLPVRLNQGMTFSPRDMAAFSPFETALSCHACVALSMSLGYYPGSGRLHAPYWQALARADSVTAGCVSKI